jgi:hypothetical protein
MVRRLTFDMRGARKAQPFGHPLDGRVRQHRVKLVTSSPNTVGLFHPHSEPVRAFLNAFELKSHATHRAKAARSEL